MYSENNIGKKVKQIREELCMSQSELAKLAGFGSRSSINKIELGVQGITLDGIYRLAKALKVPPENLLGIGGFDEIVLLYRKLDESDQKVVRMMVDSLLSADKYKQDKKGLLDA